MGILLGIHRGTRALFSDPVRGHAWMRTPSALFDGQSALERMAQGSIEDLIAVLGYLTAEAQ
nr:MbcA/ParS/Xre antitoxin family protein [Pararoseomonas baculiformis]